MSTVLKISIQMMILIRQYDKDIIWIVNQNIGTFFIFIKACRNQEEINI